MADQEPDSRAVVPATDRGALRASHADRDQVAEVLRVAAGDGRLSPDELDERLERALTARTYAELAALVADLPAAGTAVSPTAASKDLIRLHRTSSHAERRGQWVVPKRMDPKVRSGHITLDIKPGIVVDADDVTVRSGHVRVRAPWGTDVPVLLRIDIAGACGSGHITARPPRRTFWQWLRRAPHRYPIA